ncbi:cation:proton antiporter [Saccharopolyspora spinosa]|uniref:cation:proton antiporter domain-containing protein n=1 Tax=Saccharopolyspora spinosa TaxID=60894 RepID=UPI000237A4E6|nr:cation:proton antiporter [Saccharopolyspora spinosa]
MALLGYVVSLAIAVTAGFSFGAAGWVHDPMLIAVALSATSLGLVVPVLKDAGRADQAMGQMTITASSVADFAAVVLLSLLFSTSGGSTGGRLVSLIVFVAFVAAIGMAVALAGRSMRLGDLFLRLQDTTAEIRVRAAVVLLVAFVVLAEGFGLESILGAFLNLTGLGDDLAEADALVFEQPGVFDFVFGVGDGTADAAVGGFGDGAGVCGAFGGEGAFQECDAAHGTVAGMIGRGRKIQEPPPIGLFRFQ